MNRLPATPRRAPFAIRPALSAILYPLLFAALTASAFAKSPMNIVLILVDDLGWTDLSYDARTVLFGFCDHTEQRQDFRGWP